MLKRFWDSGKSLFVNEQNGILSTAVVLMFLNTITKFVGFFFFAIVAAVVGANRSSDLFYAASTLPELISNVILFGAISVSVVPILVEVLNKSGEKNFLRVFNSILNVSLVTFTVIGILLAIFVRDIFPFFLNNVIRPVDPYSPQEMELVIQMTRILLIPQIILGISTFISSILYAKNRVVMPQIAPLFYNIGRIIGTFIFAYFLHMGVWGLVWASFFGAALHLVIQLPLALKLGLKFKPSFDLKNRYVKETFKLGLPRILGIAAEQIATTVDQFIALGLVAGSATTFYFAVRLISIPLTIFGTTFATAAFPALTTSYAQGDMAKFKNIVHSLINGIFFLAIPTTVVLFILRVALVRLTFGAFDKSAFGFQSTYMTAWVVLFFAFGLAFETLRTVFYRVFYAAHDSIRPFFSAIFVVVAGVVSGVLFTNYFSHFNEFDLGTFTFNLSYFFEKSDGIAAVGGLSLSSSLVYFFEFLFLMFLINTRIVKLDFKKISISFAKKIFSAIVMGLVMYSIFKLWDNVLDVAKTANLLFLTSTTILSGCMVYIWVSYLMQDEDITLLIRLFQKIGQFIKKPSKMETTTSVAAPKL